MSLSENEKKWYRELLGVMLRAGYDINDPKSCYALRGFKLERSKEYYDSSNCLSFYAAAANNDGKYVDDENHCLADSKWINKNFKAPSYFDESTIKSLYKLSKEGRLAFLDKS